MSFSFSSSGSWDSTESWLKSIVDGNVFKSLEKYGRRGVDALSAGTPVDSGETANSWTYEVKHEGDKYIIEWHNTYVNDGVPIAIILQYGHGTGTGGYVQGRDYINPRMRPIFDQMADEVWSEVTR